MPSCYVNSKRSSLRRYVVILASLIVAVFSGCTKSTSGAAANTTKGTGTKGSGTKGTEAPDTIPGYLIDYRSFGYASEDELFSQVFAAPFAEARTDGAVVLSLKRPLDANNAAVALYGPNEGETCADFVAALIVRGGPSEEDSQFRFSIHDNIEFGSDGLSMTLYFSPTDVRLPCTALAVSDHLPENAGYRPIYGNLEFLFTAPTVYPWPEQVDIRYMSKELNTWNSTLVAADVPDGLYLSIHHSTVTNTIYVGSTSNNLYSGDGTNWELIPGFLTTVENTTDIVNPGGIVGIHTWLEAGAEHLSVIAADADHYGLFRRVGTSANFTMDISYQTISRGVEMNRAGVLSVAEGVENIFVRSMRDPSATYIDSIVAGDARGGACDAVAGSIVSAYGTSENLDFAYVCKQVGENVNNASLNFYRTTKLAGGGQTYDLIQINTDPEHSEIAREAHPAIRAEDDSNTYLLYRAKSSLKMWLVHVDSELTIEKEAIVVAPDHSMVSLHQGPTLSFARMGNGNLHILFYGVNSAGTFDLYYGVYIPGSGILRAKRIDAGAEVAVLSPIYLK